MGDTGYVFQGVQHGEDQERISDVRTGVPAQGAGAILLSAPIQRTSSLHVMNISEQDALVRARHQGTTKTQTNEALTAHRQSSTIYAGTLQFRSITPSSVTFHAAAGPVDIVDDGKGNLYDTGSVGVAANLRGTINYTTGAYSLTWASAATKPATVTYKHTDAQDFSSSAQTTTKASGGVTPSAGTPFTMQMGFGRVVPGSVSIADAGTFTFVDDGKGNILQTDVAASTAVVGTIDYGSGLVTFTTASGALTGTLTATYKYNPFASVLVKAGGAKILDLYSQIPEITNGVWGPGRKGETSLVLWGESRASKGSALIVKWGHFLEEPFRVDEVFSKVSAGGFTNDPNVSHDQAHL